MPFKAALFDMDGVIVDTEPLHRKAAFEMFAYFDIDVSEELYTSFTGRATLEMCEELVSHFGLSAAPQELVDKKREYLKVIFYKDKDFDHITELINLNKNYY